MRTIAALLLITTSALAQHRRAVTPPAPIPDDSAQLAAIIDAAGTAALSRTPGVSIAIQHNQSYAGGGWGSITPEQNIPATAQSIYWIASATKPFTATAIMQLIEQGKLTLDTPIRTFFPDLATTATVRQLLNNTSGLADYTAYLDPYGPTTAQQVLDVVRTKPVKFQPGTQFLYSNSGYYLLGLIIEQRSGKSWGDYIADEIAKPYGLTSTSQCGKPPAVPLPHGYNGVSPPFAIDPSDPSAPFAAGGICSSAADLVRFFRLLTSGEIVSADSYALMSMPTTLPNGTVVAYGFGLDLHMDGTRQTVGHDGLIRGFQSVVIHYPAERLTIAVLVNRNGSGVASSILGDITSKVFK